MTTNRVVVIVRTDNRGLVRKLCREAEIDLAPGRNVKLSEYHHGCGADIGGGRMGQTLCNRASKEEKVACKFASTTNLGELHRAAHRSAFDLTSHLHRICPAYFVALTGI